MPHFPARLARVVLFLLVVAAPLTAALAFEHAARIQGPAALERTTAAPATSVQAPSAGLRRSERIKRIEQPK